MSVHVERACAQRGRVCVHCVLRRAKGCCWEARTVCRAQAADQQGGSRVFRPTCTQKSRRLVRPLLHPHIITRGHGREHACAAMVCARARSSPSLSPSLVGVGNRELGTTTMDECFARTIAARSCMSIRACGPTVRLRERPKVYMRPIRETGASCCTIRVMVKGARAAYSWGFISTLCVG